MLTVKATKGLVGDIEVDQHGIFLGNYLIRTYPMTEEWYQHAVKVVRAANIINHRRMAGLKSDTQRNSLEASYIKLAMRLNMNHYGMTNPPREALSLNRKSSQRRPNMETV